MVKLYCARYECAELNHQSVLISRPQESLFFPPDIYFNKRSYILTKTYVLASPDVVEKFKQYCEDNKYITDLEIS